MLSLPIQTNGASTDTCKCLARKQTTKKSLILTQNGDKIINLMSSIMDAISGCSLWMPKLLWAQKSMWKNWLKKNLSCSITYKLPPLTQGPYTAFLPVARNMFWELLVLAYPALYPLLYASADEGRKLGYGYFCCKQGKAFFFSD